MLKKIIAFLAFYGLLGTWQIIRLKLPYLNRLKNYKQYTSLLTNKDGLEIGGPTPNFRKTGPLPIYEVIASLEGVNFSQTTVWEGKLTEGKNYHFEAGRDDGQQYIREATELQGIPDSKYDFVARSHCLEHVADPIRALLEWRRVVKPSGYILLVLPLREKTFDHRRPLTTLAHLISDHEHAVGEDDLSHLKEVLALHDLELDYRAEYKEVFRKRCLDNRENRCLHHHVFNETNIKELIQHIGLRLTRIDQLPPRGLIVLARKV